MELWASISGWNGFYEVSNLGAVRSLNRAILTRNGSRQMRGRVLRKSRTKNGYEMVSLTAPGTKRHYAYVHDLVLCAFAGPKSLGKECCHNNGVRCDNRLANLRYDTRSANALDRHQHGTMQQPRGVDCPSSKLTDDDVRYVRSAVSKVSYRALGRKFGVCHRTISAVVKRESWRHVR